VRNCSYRFVVDAGQGLPGLHAFTDSTPGVLFLMEIQFEENLLFTSPARWQTAQAVMLDWYDGPLGGVCELAQPVCCFHFKILAVRNNPGDRDDRLFQVSALPLDSMQRLLQALTEIGPPSLPLWTPIWRFDTEAARLNAESQVTELLARGKDTCLIIQTPDMQHFTGCWQRWRRLPAE
jgi:hypothetical protein